MPVPGGLEGIIAACLGGSGTTLKLASGVEQNKSLSMGVFTSLSRGDRVIRNACPGEFIYIVPRGGGGGGGGTFAIIVICRGVRLSNGIAHCVFTRVLLKGPRIPADLQVPDTRCYVHTTRCRFTFHV